MKFNWRRPLRQTAFWSKAGTDCVFTFLREALAGEGAPGYPNVAALSQRCEVLPAFRAAKAEFSAPRARN